MLRKLREARLAAGLTQVQVAGRLGTTQGRISKIEQGEIRIDPVELCDLAVAYRKPIAYFLPEL
ncbi:MAG: helix-turn-helix transcriptional regulator [Gemmatimonadota bacterium]